MSPSPPKVKNQNVSTPLPFAHLSVNQPDSTPAQDFDSLIAAKVQKANVCTQPKEGAELRARPHFKHSTVRRPSQCGNETPTCTQFSILAGSHSRGISPREVYGSTGGLPETDDFPTMTTTHRRNRLHARTDLPKKRGAGTSSFPPSLWK